MTAYATSHGFASTTSASAESRSHDDDMLTFALALKDKGVPIPEIAKKLTVKAGKNAGKSPSVALLYRAFSEAETDDAPTQ